MNLFKFYEQLEFALKFNLDVSSIPNNEVKELFENLNDLINKARQNENNIALIKPCTVVISIDEIKELCNFLMASKVTGYLTDELIETTKKLATYYYQMEYKLGGE